MADSSSSTKHHIPSPPSSPSAPTKPPKSKSLLTNYFFTKTLMIILVFLLFSYFPSHPPEIFKQTTIITKLWDLIYLLVIGIAVSYGLFSRKIDSVHRSDDNVGENEAYLSGISQISSLFEDGSHGIGTSYGFDDKSWVEGFKGFEIGGGKKMMDQGFVGESLVVINNEKYVLEQLGRQKTARQNLGSKSLDSAAGKSVVEDSDSDSGNWFKESRNGKFRGLVPVKLEEKFKESGIGSDSGFDSDSRTQLNRRSKSMRLEKRGDMFTGEVDENHETVVDFEGVKSQSVRFGMPSRNKSLSEKEVKGVEAGEVTHRYRKPYLNGEASFVESKLQESSTGSSFFEMNHQKKKSRLSATEIVKDYDGILDGNSEESVKEFGKVKVDDGAFDLKNNKQFVRSKSQSSSSSNASSETFKNMVRKEEKADVSSAIPKPATNANAYKRGKSVRTKRLKDQVPESKVNMFQIQTDDGKVETISKPRVDEMNANADELSDTEPHSGEVDRKAEEFIAKFKEQIRLQKVASARKLNLL